MPPTSPFPSLPQPKMRGLYAVTRRAPHKPLGLVFMDSDHQPYREGSGLYWERLVAARDVGRALMHIAPILRWQQFLGGPCTRVLSGLIREATEKRLGWKPSIVRAVDD